MDGAVNNNLFCWMVLVENLHGQLLTYSMSGKRPHDLIAPFGGFGVVARGEVVPDLVGAVVDVFVVGAYCF